MNTLKIKVVGDKTINCGGCEGNVVSAISKVAGVNKVNASRNTQMVEIFSDTDIAMEAIVAEMSGIGYQIEVA
jgi:copper chaperone CopZ